MMECKKALSETNGDIDAAAEALRKSGAAKADKKADRVTAEGRVGVASNGGNAVLVEVNSETDFVANDVNFKAFVDAVAAAALASGVADVEALKSVKLASGETVEETRAIAIQKLGENIQIRRLVKISGDNTVGTYVHSNGKIGVLVELAGGNAELDPERSRSFRAGFGPGNARGRDEPAAQQGSRRSGRLRCKGKGNRAGQDDRQGQGQAG